MKNIKDGLEQKDCSASSTSNKRDNSKLTDKCCSGHCCGMPQEMDSVIGLVSCDGDSSCPPDQVIEQRSHEIFVKPGGGDNPNLFGSSQPNGIRSQMKRPSSDCKMRELSSNVVFQGQYPMTQDYGGAGSDITGCYPLRPSSCSKTNELQGHNVFGAFLYPSQTLPPPPVLPYLPEEMRIPPEKLRRNCKAIGRIWTYASLRGDNHFYQPQKLASHLSLGGPEFLDPPRPQSESSWARQRMLCGSDIDETIHGSHPKSRMSASKTRELAGQINIFTDARRRESTCSTPSERENCVHSCAGNDRDARQNHRRKIQALVGNNAVFLSDGRSGTQYWHPVSEAKVHELRGSNIFSSPNFTHQVQCDSRDTPDPSKDTRMTAISHEKE